MSVVLGSERRSYYMRGKIPVIIQHEDETVSRTIDFSKRKPIEQDGETIASVVVEANGVTVTGEAPANGKDGTQSAVSMTVQGSGGYVKITATTNNSQVMVQYVEFEEPSRPNKVRDYGNRWP